MLIIITVMTFITAFVLIYLLLHAYTSTQGTITMRLKALESFPNGGLQLDEELAKPFMQRVLAPLTSELAVVLSKFTPKSIRNKIEARLSAAGGFGGVRTG